jgi:hypothetical protein
MGMDDQLQESLAIMETIATSEENSVGFSLPLSSVVNKPFISICNPYSGFTIDTSKGPYISCPCNLVRIPFQLIINIIWQVAFRGALTTLVAVQAREH